MNRKDLELPPELAEMVARRRRVSRAPEAAKGRLHRRLSWAFTATQAPPGWLQRLRAVRLAALPAAWLTYLPLAVAGIGFGAVSLSVVHVLSRRAEPPAAHQSVPHRPASSRPTDRSPPPAAPPLSPLPELIPSPQSPELGAPQNAPAANVREAPPAQVVGAPAASGRQGGASLPALTPVPSELAPDLVPQEPPASNPSVLGTAGTPPPVLAPALERQLLEEARRQLRSGAVPNALDTLDQHRRLYPEGQLSEEREVLVIEGTVRFRGTAAARPMVEAFRQRFPRSPLLPALEAFLKQDQSQSNLKGVP